MKIRLMEIEDFDSMYSLWKEVGLNVADYEIEKEDIKQIIKWNPVTCFVICDGNKIIGTVLGTFNGRRAWIYHLAIHPNFQNQSLGSLLLEKTESALKKAGAKRLLLGVSKTNLRVLGFYTKHGYGVVNDSITLGKNLVQKPNSDIAYLATKRNLYNI